MHINGSAVLWNGKKKFTRLRTENYIIPQTISGRSEEKKTSGEIFFFFQMDDK
jgi:hypothetical protein